MATLEELLLYPVLLVDGFIQYSPVFLYPVTIREGYILYHAPPSNPNIIMDSIGSFLPVIWGTCVLNQMSRMACKVTRRESYPYEYINPLIATALMTAIEISQKYQNGVYDKNDIYAGILGGIVSLGIGITSKWRENKKQ